MAPAAGATGGSRNGINDRNTGAREDVLSNRSDRQNVAQGNREDRFDDRQDRRSDVRDARTDRDFASENREDRVENRMDRRDDVAGNREDRFDDRQGRRDDRFDNRIDRRDDRVDNRQGWTSQLPANARARGQYRQDWGNGIRGEWHDQWQNWKNEFKDDFGEPGWRLEYPNMANAYFNYHHPYANGWWAFATTAAITGWVAGGWGTAGYADYGSGGSTYYDDGQVYQDGQPVATSEEYAEQAQDLAATGSEALNDPNGKPMDWMPLGTFALSTSKDDKDPSRMLQLAISKEGVINGTMFNLKTQKTSPIQGAVDRKTQRVSFFAGDKKDVVAETGIFNLTKDEAPLLVHFGTDHTEEYLLVRLPAPDDMKTDGKTQK